ncbi:MAG: hypothetical protein Q8N99_04860 [Nanoarchaeota archaeon]|nr:hypothetical protein [Nanoarchaeota archaeon]
MSSSRLVKIIAPIIFFYSTVLTSYSAEVPKENKQFPRKSSVYVPTPNMSKVPEYEAKRLEEKARAFGEISEGGLLIGMIPYVVNDTIGFLQHTFSSDNIKRTFDGVKTNYKKTRDEMKKSPQYNSKNKPASKPQTLKQKK